MILNLVELFTAMSNGLSVRQDKSGLGAPITRIETISSGTIDPQRVGYADVSASEHERWVLQPSDILFSHINSPDRVGTCALYEGRPDPLVHGMNLLRLRPRFETVEPRFALYLLRSEPFRARLRPFVNKAVNQASVSLTNLKSIPVELPPLVEQRRIVAILDQANALVMMSRQALACHKDLARSLYMDYFGDPLSNERIWPLVSIGELGVVTTGRTPPTSMEGMFDGPVPFVTPGDLESGSAANRTLTVEGAARSRMVRAGATLVCCIGTIGKVGLAKTPCAFNQQINAIEWGPDIEDAYGYASIQLRRKLMAGLGASTTIPMLSKTQFSKIRVPVPPVQLQKEYASKVEVIQAAASSHDLRAKKLAKLFASLRHEAFIDQI